MLIYIGIIIFKIYYWYDISNTNGPFSTQNWIGLDIAGMIRSN